MNRRFVLVAICSLAVILSGCGLTSGGTEVPNVPDDPFHVFVNFEDMVAGQPPSGDDWRLGTSGDLVVPVISDELSASGSQSLKSVNKPEMGHGSSQYIDLLFESQESGVLEVSYEVFIPSGQIGAIGYMALNGDDGVVLKWQNTLIRAYSDVTYDLVNFPVDEWHTIKTLVDLDDQTYRVFLNDAEITTSPLPFAKPGNISSLDYMRIRVQTWGGTPPPEATFYVDDISISAIQ